MENSEEENFTDDNKEDDWNQAWDQGSSNNTWEMHTQPSHTIGNPKVDPQQSNNNVIIRHAKKDDSEKAQKLNKSSSIVSRMALNDNKAGMEGLDKDRINAIIYEASKGSKYYENEKKKEAQVKQRMEQHSETANRLTQKQIETGYKEADRLLQTLEATRDLSKFIVHMDMDMFYAAVEMRDDPSLKTKPMAVGGNDMLSTSNYIARKFGVRAAMPGFIAKKLCPHLVIVPTSFKKYTAVSKEIRAIMAEYDPNYSPMSLDEAYLDFTPHMKTRPSFSVMARTYPQVKNWKEDCSCSLEVKSKQNDVLVKHNISTTESTNNHENKEVKEDASKAENTSSQSECPAHQCHSCGKTIRDDLTWQTFDVDIEDAVKEMRFRIEQKTGLTASAGIGPNTMVAKICSDKNKPNGQYRVMPTEESVKNFIDELPIRKVSGIGKVSAQMLSALDIEVCSDLMKQRGVLYHLYSQTAFHHFMSVALGLGHTTVGRDGERKSISVERTFRELSLPDDLYKKCLELSQSLSEDLQEEKMMGKTVTIKIKTVAFEVFTRAHTLPNYTDTVEQIYAAAKDLLRVEIKARAPEPLRLRLMGVRMSNLLIGDQIEKQKQTTITGLFSKLGNKVKSSNTSPEKSSTQSCVRDSKQIMKKPASIDTMFKTMNDKIHKGTCQDNPGPMNADVKCDNEGIGVKRNIYTCPSCNYEIPCDNMEEFNDHLDECVIISPQAKIDQDPHRPEIDIITLDTDDSCEKTLKATTSSSDAISGVIIKEQSPTKNSQPTIIESFMKSPKKSNNTDQSTTNSVKLQTNLLASFEETEPKASTSKESSETVVCPVCGKDQPFSDLVSMNKHIDACLNQSTIQTMLQEKESQPSSKRISSTNDKQVPSKKRKVSVEQSIQSFFKRKH